MLEGSFCTIVKKKQKKKLTEKMKLQAEGKG